jgi:hypothetical protein
MSVSYQLQTGSIDDLTIIASDGTKVNVKNLLLELSYYEDIFSFSNSGYIVLRDSQGLIQSLNIIGQEDIIINFGKIPDGVNNISLKMKIYKIDNRTAVTNTTGGEIYKIYFCSEDLILSEQIKISKSYVGKVISDIVKDVLSVELKSQNKMFVIEPTTGIYDFIVPRLKPFESISWLSTYALPTKYASGNDVAADMLMFETKNGFNFVSLRSLYDSTVYADYNYQEKNIQSDYNTNSSTVLRYDFINNLDHLQQINSGAFANKVWQIDPMAKRWQVTEYNYAKNTEVKNTLDDGSIVLTDSKNRLGKTSNQMTDSSFKVVIGNFDEKLATGITGDSSKVNSVANDIRVNKYIPKRTAQLSLINSIVLKIVISGDPGITAGRVINFNLPSRITPKEKDPRYSGKYLVTAVRHILQSQGVYQTVLEISKESFPK